MVKVGQNSVQILKNSRKQLFVQKKTSSISSSGHRDAFLENMPKNDKKLKLSWMFEKIYLLEKFSEKHVFPQEVPLEALSPVLITLPTFFRQKSLFSTECKKNSLSLPAPGLKNVTKLNIFPGKSFFSEKSIWTDKDTILTICFQSSKNICPMSRKSLKENDSTRKKTIYLDKALQICASQFWQSCWSFLTIVRFFH